MAVKKSARKFSDFIAKEGFQNSQKNLVHLVANPAHQTKFTTSNHNSPSRVAETSPERQIKPRIDKESLKAVLNLMVD